jgi:hypothetical protein
VVLSPQDYRMRAGGPRSQVKGGVLCLLLIDQFNCTGAGLLDEE